MKVALVQLNSTRDITSNLTSSEKLIRMAANTGADFIATPENTTSIEPDRKAALANTPEESDHPGVPFYSNLAKDLRKWLLIGSMPVKVKNDKLANRCFLFDPAGQIAARYDKIHLFDVDLKAGESYRESDQIDPGKEAVIANTPWCGIGFSICYDVRFAALYRALAQAGASILTVPAAFTVPTGKAHWHVLLRARAIETGSFVLAPAQCGIHAEGRKTYGHSLIINPWGEVLAEGGEEPGIIYADLNLQDVIEARRMIPALRHDRSFTKPLPPLRQAGE